MVDHHSNTETAGLKEDHQDHQAVMETTGLHQTEVDGVDHHHQAAQVVMGHLLEDPTSIMATMVTMVTMDIRDGRRFSHDWHSIMHHEYTASLIRGLYLYI